MEEVKEDITNDETVDTQVNEETTSENQPSIETLTVQKSKALEQRDEARAKIVELEASAESSKENKPTQTVDKSDDGLRSELETIKFTVANKELDSDNVAEIVDYARGKGISLQEAKKSPVIEAYLKADQEQKSLSEASPDGTRSPKTKIQKQPTTFDEHEEWARKQMGI